jgi:hypothetical protein
MKCAIPAWGNHRACENGWLTSKDSSHHLFMTVFMTVFRSTSNRKPHAYWRLTRFNIIARYVERMLGDTLAKSI